MGGKRGWVHVAASHYHDVVPCVKQRVPVIWVNRNKETLDSSQKKPTAEVAQPAKRPPSCSASPSRRRRRARLVSLHPDVTASSSSAVAAGQLRDRRGGAGDGETFVIDSPVLPDELDALPALIEQARFPAPSGLLATHGDWDHLLGRLAFPGLALGCAESTAGACAAEPGVAQRELRDFDEELCIDRSAPLALGSVQALPGARSLRDRRARARAAPRRRAHGRRYGRLAIPWAGVLVAGDYLSPVEIPVLQRRRRDSILPRRRSSACAAARASRPSTSCPATGRCSTASGRSAILEEDLAYLERLRERRCRRRAAARAPLARAARRCTQRNVVAVSG